MNKIRPIYIGQGKTIYVEPHKDVIALLDIPKLDKYFEKNPDATIEVGAKRDWFFTAEDVTKEKLKDVRRGLAFLVLASDWDTFKFIKPDGTEEDCTLTVPTNLFNIAHLSGSRLIIDKMQRWFHDIYNLLMTLAEDKRDDMVKEVNAILDKYAK
jgi:hypothetical protein